MSEGRCDMMRPICDRHCYMVVCFLFAQYCQPSLLVRAATIAGEIRRPPPPPPTAATYLLTRSKIGRSAAPFSLLVMRPHPS